MRPESLYYSMYYRLRPALINMMFDGVAWDREAAEKERDRLVQKKEVIKRTLDQLTGKFRLYSIHRHKSARLNELLLEQRSLRTAKGHTAERSPERRSFNDKIKQVQAQLRELRGSGGDVDFVVGDGLSNKAVGEYIYGQLGVGGRRRRRKDSGKSTVTVDNRALLKVKQDHPEHQQLIDLILEHRRCEKLASTYLNPKKLLSPVDGRFHSQLKPYGTQSGRLASSSDPWGHGGNMQNIDRSLKWLFIPE